MLSRLLIPAVVAGALFCTDVRAQDAPTEAEDVAMAVRGSNAFALDLYRSVYQGDDRNLFLSPFSISAALSMAYAGAEEETAAEMAATLGISLPDERLHAAYRLLYERLVEVPSELAIANALWVDDGFTLRPEYVRLLDEQHGAAAREVQMRGDAAEQINAWTSEQTRGRIGQIVNRSALQDAALVLTNAIYFLGQWDQAFDPARTGEEPFTRADGSRVSAQLMHQRGSFRYAAAPDFQVIELPYEDGALNMTILLPRDHDGLEAMLGDLTIEELDAVLGRLARRDVHLYLPRFEMEHSLSLSDALIAMGMPTAFDEGRADFGGMAELPPSQRLFISDVLHKAFVSVDEEGTEAAAATAVIVGVTSDSVDPPQPVIFRADRPFLFLIRDAGTGSILFTGHVADPAALE